MPVERESKSDKKRFLVYSNLRTNRDVSCSHTRGIAVCQTAKLIDRKIVNARGNPQRKLVGLDIDSGIVPSNGDCVRVGRIQVGEITSAVKSPVLGKTIALARVDMAHAENGTAIEVGQLDGQQKRLTATVVPFPHFDPSKGRVRGNYG